MLRNHGILFEETPARRHNKIMFVESGHKGIRLFVQRLLKKRRIQFLALWPVYPEAGDSVESYALVQRTPWQCEAEQFPRVLSSVSEITANADVYGDIGSILRATIEARIALLKCSASN